MSDKRMNSYRRWKKEYPSGPLTMEEFELFERKRIRVWKGLGVMFAYSLCFVLLDTLRTHYGLAFSEVMVVLTGFPVGICLLFLMLAFQCPRCGEVPKARRVSIFTGGVEYGSYVPLRPKSCWKCGAQFVKPVTENSGESQNEVDPER